MDVVSSDGYDMVRWMWCGVMKVVWCDGCDLMCDGCGVV